MARYIDADEVLRMMRNVKSDKPSYGTWDMACDCCIDSVDVTPTADVAEVKHGKWIGNNGTKAYDDYRCSCCGNYVDIRNQFLLPFYCGFCGAKMDEKKGE